VQGNLNPARQEAKRALQQGRTYKQLDRVAQAMTILGRINLTEGNLEQAASNFISASSYAFEFNPKIYEVTISKIVYAISEIRKDQPMLDWQFLFEKIEQARDSNNEVFVSAILEIAKEKN
jgi:hypothetical protein